MRRLPRRRGFVNHFRIEYQPVNLRDLERFDDGTEVTAEVLKEAGLIDSAKKPVKILAAGEITRKLTVRVERLSLTAKEKIVAAGGTAEETTERKVRSERRGAAKRKRRKSTPAETAAEDAGEGDDKKGGGKAKAQKGDAPAKGDKGGAEEAGESEGKKGGGKAKAQKGDAKAKADKGGAETEARADEAETADTPVADKESEGDDV